MAALLASAVLALPQRSVAGTESHDEAGGRVATDDGRAWLERIGEASARVSFEGVLILGAGGRTTAARIAHYSDGRNQVERIEALDGPPRIVYRYNEQVKTVWPERQLASSGPYESLVGLGGLLRGAGGDVLRYYQVELIGRDRIAGRPARVLVLRPRDEWRLGHRFWADEASGLLLRAEVLGPQDRVLEWSALSSVDIGVAPQTEQVLQAMRRDDGLIVRQLPGVRTDAGREGWSIGSLPPGFRLVGAVNRPHTAVVSAQEGAGPAMLQLVFSDGLTHASLFIEPADAARPRRESLSAVGATQTLVRRAGSWWLTAVGDVPPATLHALCGALRRER